MPDGGHNPGLHGGVLPGQCSIIVAVALLSVLSVCILPSAVLLERVAPRPITADEVLQASVDPRVIMLLAINKTDIRSTRLSAADGRSQTRAVQTGTNATSHGARTEIGVALRGQIQPPWWSTGWFGLCCGLAGALVRQTIGQIRLRQLARRMDILFGERLAERTRIAQELHDKLLQGFLSASMYLHVAIDQVPANSPAGLSLARALQLMGEAIEEDRNAVRELRASPADSHDLEQAFSRIRRELVIEGQVDFCVAVAGRPRPLHPIIRDEVYRIGREALMNAFRHSGARAVEVDLEYTARYLRLVVRDNGCGIDPRVLRTGREGHGGLSGMRERLALYGGALRIDSRKSVGTTVTVSFPADRSLPAAPEPRRATAAGTKADSV